MFYKDDLRLASTEKDNAIMTTINNDDKVLRQLSKDMGLIAQRAHETDPLKLPPQDRPRVLVAAFDRLDDEARTDLLGRYSAGDWT